MCLDVELQRARHEGIVDPFDYVLKMRGQRNHMVHTEVSEVIKRYSHSQTLEDLGKKYLVSDLQSSNVTFLIFSRLSTYSCMRQF